MPFPVDITFIEQAEEKLAMRFPMSFKARMAKNNGGSVTTNAGWEEHWNLFPFFDTSDKTRLKRTCNDIIRETASAHDRPGFPSDAVAIGDNGGGDVLILLPDSDDPTRLGDAIFWWDHETDAIEQVGDDFLELRA